MSFNKQNLARLRELGRQLPQEEPKFNLSEEKKKKQSYKKHSIETEEDPEILFHELMKASQDGTVPFHLLSRLKNIESKNH